MKKRLRILILEDIEEDAMLIDRVLDKENIPFTRFRVDTRSAFTEALDAFHPDIILSDHALPAFNSIEAIKICKQKKIDAPFILVTGAVSEEFAVNCLRHGAHDYILKSNLSRLPMAIQHAIRQHKYENERIKQGAKLKNQNEELIKINNELDSFVYSISHKLRSPLSSVLGLVNIAKLERPHRLETAYEYFDMIEKSVLKLDQTLQEILDYSQNIRTELDVTEINVQHLFDTCLDRVKKIEGNEAVVTALEIRQDTPFYSDYYRLSIILDNLVGNAIRYRDESKEKMEVKIGATINPAYAKISVTDNGIGIAAAYIPQVFTMFFRASEKSEGAGLGLYIVKEIVAKLGGKIVLTSVPNEKTEVTLSIPNKLLTA